MLLDGFAPALGDHFDLFDLLDHFNWNGSFGSTSGAFASLQLPTSTGDLVWDTSRIYGNGEIGVNAVPGPATAVLLLSGAAMLAWVTKRHGLNA